MRSNAFIRAFTTSYLKTTIFLWNQIRLNSSKPRYHLHFFLKKFLSSHQSIMIQKMKFSLQTIEPRINLSPN